MKYLLLKEDSKDNDSSRRMQGKRSLANFNACMVELRTVLPTLFLTIHQALDEANARLRDFPLHARSRTLEASVMQSCFANALFQNFGDKAFYGKYKRLILRCEGYVILFKKLNKKGMPMNIKTSNVQGILAQHQTLDLFAGSSYNEDPILYFGYQKDKIGEYINPQLVYIDEDKIKFNITEYDLEANARPSTKQTEQEHAKPMVTRKQINERKAN